MSTTRPHPPLPLGLRPATPADIPRLAVIYIAAFKYSPTMRYQRPYYQSYPSDLLAWYISESIRYFEDPSWIVLVATDKFNADERGKTEATLPAGWETGFTHEVEGGTEAKVEPAVVDTEAAGNEQLGVTKQRVHKGDEVPVAVAVWHLSPALGQKWRSGSGAFLNTASLPPKPELLLRDMHPGHRTLVQAQAREVYGRHFQNLMTLDMMANHPAYWRRGHGARLVQWGQDFARMHGVGQGVMGPQMGMRLYVKQDFEVREAVEWDADEVTDWKLRLEFAVWIPEGVKEMDVAKAV